jgi:hypothetical protein
MNEFMRSSVLICHCYDHHGYSDKKSSLKQTKEEFSLLATAAAEVLRK